MPMGRFCDHSAIQFIIIILVSSDLVWTQCKDWYDNQRDYNTHLCTMSGQDQVTQGLSYWPVQYAVARSGDTGIIIFACGLCQDKIRWQGLSYWPVHYVMARSGDTGIIILACALYRDKMAGIIIMICALCHDMIGDTGIIILTSHYVIRLSYWPVHYVRTRSGDSNYRTDYCQRIIVLNCTLCHGIIRWHNDYHTDMNPVSKDYHTDLCIMSWQEQVTQGLSYWLVHYVMA